MRCSIIPENFHLSREQSGVTLIELLLVVSVLSIMAGLTIPSYMNLMPNMRLNGAARTVMSELMWARMSAVKENNRYRIFFLNDHQYKILDDDNSNNSEDSGEATVTKNIQDKYHDVTFNANNNPIFKPQGTASSLPSITLQNSSGNKTVSISIAGRVKIN